VNPQRGRHAAESDLLADALARFVEALHRRYPDGPGALAAKGLARRANMPVVTDRKEPPAA
jgi:hypothetical protein